MADRAERSYAAIDLKSFYASVECVERGLDPLTTNLVVADVSRTEKTICLAVSPSLKRYGIPGRARLFEVVSKVREINAARRKRAPGGVFRGTSCDIRELDADPSLELSYIAATPQMAHYMEFSTRIYHIYLQYVAPEDIHVYSIDEVFIDLTDYLTANRMTAREMTMKMILDVLHQTGITATAGLAPNLFLCKAAMDIEAKHIQPDKNGVRIAELDEMSFRRNLWDHKPLTDFWRVGKGYAKKLEACGLYTMGDIARCSVGAQNEYYNEELLYGMFGVNAELLIDHAWGWEPCTMQEIKAYRPESNSLSHGQVLLHPYPYDKGMLIAREMAELMALQLVERELVTDQVELIVGYDIENLEDPVRKKAYNGPTTTDFYGRKLPKEAHGSANLPRRTASSRLIVQAILSLYEKNVNPTLLLRRMHMIANHVTDEREADGAVTFEQFDLFTDQEAVERARAEEDARLAKEKRMQKAMLSIQHRYGKNAILKGMNLEEGATTVERNQQIGGHKA